LLKNDEATEMMATVAMTNPMPTKRVRRRIALVLLRLLRLSFRLVIPEISTLRAEEQLYY
jgi:hypothetical protein